MNRLLKSLIPLVFLIPACSMDLSKADYSSDTMLDDNYKTEIISEYKDNFEDDLSLPIRDVTPRNSIEYDAKFLDANDSVRTHFPELDDVSIDFVIRKTDMTRAFNSMPDIKSLFGSKENRRYTIYVNENDYNYSFFEHMSPSEVRGILGHEYGHIMQYEELSFGDFIRFGFDYLRHSNEHHRIELDASFNAIKKGLASDVFASLNYFINSAFSSEHRSEAMSKYVPGKEDLESFLDSEF